MAGRGMGAASRGGGAVSKGPKNKMISEPSKSTGRVLMMAKGGAVQKFRKGGMPLPADRSTGYSGRPMNISVTPSSLANTAKGLLTAASFAPGPVGTAAKIAGLGLGAATNPSVRKQAQAFYDDFAGDMPADQQVTMPVDEGQLNYRRGGAVRKKDYMKKKASMMRKGGMADKKGRAMKSKSKDSRGRAMRGY